LARAAGLALFVVIVREPYEIVVVGGLEAGSRSYVRALYRHNG
jgi:hypothetical protein